MKNERKFCKCSHCGNIISFIHNSGVELVCCGEKMQEIKPNTTDGAKEKHVPSAVRAGGPNKPGKLTVTVGSVSHPMTEEHHIAWIIAANGSRTQRVVLQPASAPAAEFEITGEPVTIYAYCNLHGLWALELD